MPTRCSCGPSSPCRVFGCQDTSCCSRCGGIVATTGVRQIRGTRGTTGTRVTWFVVYGLWGLAGSGETLVRIRWLSTGDSRCPPLGWHLTMLRPPESTEHERRLGFSTRLASRISRDEACSVTWECWSRRVGGGPHSMTLVDVGPVAPIMEQDYAC